MASRYTGNNMPSLGRQNSMEEALRPAVNPHGLNRSDIGPLRQIALVAILLLGLLVSSIDASIVSTALVKISLELKDFLKVPWVALSYLLAYLGFATGFAKLSDIYGRRSLIIASWVLFSGFSLGCGMARTMTQLIVCRAFQGIGGSGLYSLSQIGLFEVGPSHNPSMLGALIGMTLAISFVLGPVLGGTISELASWRWIFFINLPCGALSLAGLLLVWPQGQRLSQSGWRTFTRIDFPGNGLLIMSTTLLVFALQEAGTFTYAWDGPVIVGSLVIAGIGAVGFVLWEFYLGWKGNSHIQPLFSLRIMRNRVFLAAVMFTFFSGFNYLALIIILPERFQIINLDSSLMAGIHLLPLLGACAFGSFLSGALSKKGNNTSPTLIMSSVLQLIGIGLLSTFSDVDTGIKAQYGYQTIFGLGTGMAFGAATILTSIQTHPEDRAVAQGAIAQARVLGGAIGIATCTIIFNNLIDERLANIMNPEDLKALHNSPTIAHWLQAEQREAIRNVYATAFTDCVKTMICASAVGLMASLFTYEVHPPQMPTVSQLKEQMAGTRQRNESESELDEFSIHRTAV